MNLMDLLADSQWDTAFFKILANNDTGQAEGHQAGIVLPKALRQYLPDLDASTTSRTTPTVDRYVLAEMYDGVELIAEVDVRYQLQTWGGTRPPESRITEGTAPLRNRAHKDDLLIFQRRADSLERFRMVLVRQGTPGFRDLLALAGVRRWGPLAVADRPVSQDDVLTASQDLEAQSQGPFEILQQGRERTDTRQFRLARSAAFRERIRSEYSGRCAVSGITMKTPSGLWEVESAHVVPLHEGGPDDFRNGLALSRTLHWAFDRGLLGVLPDHRVYLPKRVRKNKCNAFLCGFAGTVISKSKTPDFRVHPKAFAWHLENRVRQWD